MLFSDHNELTPEISNWKMTEKSPKPWKLNTLLNQLSALSVKGQQVSIEALWPIQSLLWVFKFCWCSTKAGTHKYINKWAQLWSNKTLFTNTEMSIKIAIFIQKSDAYSLNPYENVYNNNSLTIVSPGCIPARMASICVWVNWIVLLQIIIIKKVGW